MKKFSFSLIVFRFINTYITIETNIIEFFSKNKKFKKSSNFYCEYNLLTKE